MGNRLRALLFIFVFALCNNLFSEPMLISFNDMIKQSKTIAIGTYIGFSGKNELESFQYYFVVEKLLKGAPTKDTLVLNRASGAVHLAPGTQCIAFINMDDGFEWVGTCKSSTKISDPSLIFMEGFYDWNAYIVSPATISVSQLKDYLKNESYSGSIYGDLYFFSNETKKMEASSVKIEVNYTYKNNAISSEVKLNGADLNDFKNKAGFSLPNWDHIVTIEYEYNLVRPLKIKGQFEDLHPGEQRFHAMFWLEAPEELTYSEFLDFLKNPAYGHPYYELEVKTLNDKTYTILLNDEIGRVGKLLDYNGKNMPISSLSTAPVREICFGNYSRDLVLVLDSCLVDKKEFDYAGDDLVRELKMGSIGASIYTETGEVKKFISRCTLSYKSTKFAKNPNYK